MPERKNVTIDVGPLYTRGDLVKAPDGTSSKIRNCVVRRGVLEKRPGFLRESAASVPTTCGVLNEYVGSSAVYLVATDIADGTSAEYRNADGSWTAMNTNAGYGGVEYDGTFWMLGREGGALQSSIDSFDGSTVTVSATKTKIGGTALGSHIGRLIVGSPTFYHDNGGQFLFAFNSAAEWTVSGAWSQPTGATIRTATIANATTDTIKSANSVYTTGSTEEYVTVCFEIQAASATVSTPIRVRVENSTGATVYGSQQYVVSNSTIDPEWRQYYVTALVPASTAVYAALQIGNDTGGGTIGVQFRMADSANNHGFAVYEGRFIYPYGAQSAVSVISGTEYRNRIYWSEPLSFTDWRNENFAEIDEVPGETTAIGVVNGRLVVFKKNGMWIFAPTASALNPFSRELFLPRVGCLSGTAMTVFDNTMYFVAENEIYAFSGSSAPNPICGDAIKDEIFSSVPTYAVTAVDSDNRELWVSVGGYKIYVYSIDDGAWIGYYQLTDSAGSETPFSPYGRIVGMTYALPQGESSREMWISFTTALNTTTIAKLRSSQTSDNLDGTERDIVAEYVFHPLESPRPRKAMTLQRFGIDHKITGSQAAATTEYAVSLDGGATWGKYNQVRIPVSSGGSIDTDPIRVPLHQTSPRIAVKIKHTGPGGPTYFNMTGGEAEIIVRGRETQATNPTAVGSSL